MTRRTPLLTVLLALAAAVAAAQVCDLEELATISTPGSPTHPLVVGSTAYVAAGSAGLLRNAVADPVNLELLDATPTQGQALDIAYEYFGNQLVVAEGVSGIGSYDVQESGPPVHLGTTDVGDTPVSVEVHLYHASGSRYGIVSRTLQPFEMTQYDRIYNRVNAGVVDSGFAVVKVLTTGGEVLAYASVVDNGSNDPIFIPAQRLSDTSPFTH